MQALNWLLFVIILELIYLIGYLAYLARKKLLQQEDDIRILTAQKFPYLLNKYTLNDSEREFFKILQNLEVIKENYSIFPQLNLDKLMYIPKGTPNYWIYLNEIKRKFVDFTLFDNQTLLPRLVIELDGDPHVIDGKVICRDKFVDDALTKVGIKILRIPRFDKHYNIEALNKKISSKLIQG